ncbi:MAG: SIMPL domain-containing protein [Candidatus Peribacteria bacterium]|nr:SIMPL domain-containing protein [Candidatus Peribacteria bacterium]
MEGNVGVEVTGKGIVKVQPDTLTLTFNVQERAATTKEAQTKIDTISEKFMLTTQELGVEKRSIQTSNYSVHPNYHWDNETNKQTIDGYNASQTIVITLNGSGFVELGQQVLSVAPNVGNISINGSSFSVTDKSKGEQEARTLAVQHAYLKAQQLAKVAKAKLGKPVRISETVSVGGFYPTYANAKVMNDAVAEREETATLEMGENEISVNVNITYAIK